MNELFKNASPIVERLLNSGYEAYFVGGSVRDSIMKREIHDVDIATSATPEEVKQLFDHTIDIGIQHGTVLILKQGHAYEVTTFRTETEYKDFRRPTEVIFIRTLVDDLRRRDFTMNAIAMDLEGKLLDPFNGIDDIKNRLIRTVGEAEDRFHEDALRMLRAVRFVSQLGFSLEPSTKDALKKNAPLLKHIAQERKSAEFERLLAGKNRMSALDITAEAGLLDYFPELDKLSRQFTDFSELHTEHCATFEEWLAVICLFEGKTEQIYREWKLPSDTIKKVGNLIKGYSIRSKRPLKNIELYTFGLDLSTSIEKVWAVLSGQQPQLDGLRAAYEQLPIKPETGIDVSGTDLMAWSGKRGGPWIKEVLHEILLAILEKKLENKKELIKKWLIQENRM